MNLADSFKNWLKKRAAEEIPDEERQRLNRLKEYLRGPLPPEARDECVAEIRALEQRYKLPQSSLYAD